MHSPPKRATADDTFAKLMRVHAWVRGGRPAFRLKDLGIWRTWTWAEVYAETRALAPRLCRGSALGKGDRIAIAGANRPRLYWSIAAAQMLGAIPVPVYADSVADEIAAVLENAGASLIVAQDQEQVDKALSIARPPAAADRACSTTRRAASPTTTTPRLLSLDRLIVARAAPNSPNPEVARCARRAHRRAATAATPRSCFTPPARPGARRAWCSPASAASPRRATPSPSTI